LTALGRQALHAYLLGFEHPVNHETQRFRSAVPTDLAELRHTLRANPKLDR
jgi:23S rRNA pseudouridine1911/1915/1917 synthase